MKTGRKTLETALKLAQKVVGSENSYRTPILQTVLLDAQDGKLQLRATDLTTEILLVLRGEEDLAPIAIEPKHLLAAVSSKGLKARAFAPDTVVVKTTTRSETVSGKTCPVCDGTTWTDRQRRWTVPEIEAAGPERKCTSCRDGRVLEEKMYNTLAVTSAGRSFVLDARANVADFPAAVKLRDGQRTDLNVREFVEELDYALAAASADETRPHLHCVRLEPTRTAATDGHRLHLVHHATRAHEPVSVPRGAAEIWRAALALPGIHSASLLVGEHQSGLYAVGDNLSIAITAKNEEGQFPPIDAVLNGAKKVDSVVHVGRDALIAAVETARGLCDLRVKLVRIESNGVLRISADTDHGTFVEEVCAETSDHAACVFNAEYLLAALRPLGEEVVLNLSEIRVEKSADGLEKTTSGVNRITSGNGNGPGPSPEDDRFEAIVMGT